MSSPTPKNLKNVNYDNIEWKDLDKRKFYTLMPAGSITIRVLVYPIQLVKTRMQTLAGYSSLTQAFKYVIRNEGAKGLYRGFGTSLLGLPIGPVFVTTLETSKQTLKNVWTQKLEAKTITTQQYELGLRGIPFLSSGFSSAVAQGFVVPIDIVTQRLQVDIHETVPGETPVQKKTALQIAKSVMEKEGMRGMYRGYGMSLIAYAPTSSLLWGNYYWISDQARRLFKTKQQGEMGGHHERWDTFEARDLLITPASGFLSASIAGICTNPLDILRTRVQVNETNIGIRATFRELLADPRGWRVFWTGTTPRIVSMGSSSAVVFSMYELLKRVAAK